MANEVIKPADVHVPTGYNHAFKAGNTVYTAGQVALDRDENVVGKGDIEAQTDQVFKNLQAVLAAAGGSLQDVVKLTIYITQQGGPAQAAGGATEVPDGRTAGQQVVVHLGPGVSRFPDRGGGRRRRGLIPSATPFGPLTTLSLAMLT